MKKQDVENKVFAAGARLGIIALALVLSGCGSSYASDSAAVNEFAAAESAYDAGYGYASNSLYTAGEAKFYDEEAVEEEWDSWDDTDTAPAESEMEAPVDTSRKLITTMNISAETEELDELLSHVESRVSALGGYIENSDISNGGYRAYGDKTRSYRYANLTIRIPASNLSSFITDVSERTNITNQSKSVEDVTLTYTDLESHKRMLKAEEDRLLKFMEQAETIEDMIAVEGRLTEVQYQLDSMESQLRTFDNRINYSTVNLNIEEVIEYTVTTEPQTVWEEIAVGFVESLKDVGEGFRDFFVWFVTHIPQLVVWAVVIFIIVRVVIAIRRRRLKALNERAASGTGRPLTPRELRRLQKQSEKEAKKAAKKGLKPESVTDGNKYGAGGQVTEQPERQQ